MTLGASLALNELLAASDSEVREAAWEKLIVAHTRLLLSVARSFGGGKDEAMDRYAYILEKLRDSDFRRLRAFDSTAGVAFSTWLVVSSRRLCVDFNRSRYGRVRASTKIDEAKSLRELRRALKDSTTADVDADSIADAQPTIDAQSILDERDAILRGELRRLSARERFMLALRYQDDLPASRIAEIIGVRTPFHVYRQLEAIHTKLRQALVTRGIDSSSD